MKIFLTTCFYLIIFSISVSVEATDNDLPTRQEAKSIPINNNEIDPQVTKTTQKSSSPASLESLPSIVIKYIAFEFLSLKEVGCLRIANRYLLNKLCDVFKKKLKVRTEKIIREEYDISLDIRTNNLDHKNENHKSKLLDFCPLEMLHFVFGEEAELLRACLLLYSEKYEEGFEMLSQTKGLPEVLQKKFNHSVYILDKSQKFMWEIGKKYLLKRSEKGDQDAQKWLNQAANFCELNFDKETGRKYLEERAKKGDQNAQKWLNEAAYRCKLGFDTETARKYLEERIKLGDQDAQKWLNQAAYYCTLGFDKKTRKKYLEERIKLGDQDAQEQLNQAAYFCELNFDKETGRKYLEERAKKGDQNAQKWLHDAACFCKLNFDKETGRKYLEERIKLGDHYAQERLNQAAYYRQLNFDKKTARTYLEERVKLGDQDAQKWLNQAAYGCWLGFNKETGRKYLEDRIKLGDLDVQKFLNKAALVCKLGFDEKTGREYLEKRLKLKDQHAQKLLIKDKYSFPVKIPQLAFNFVYDVIFGLDKFTMGIFIPMVL